ncbi:MAG: aminopeptidase N [Mycobacteriales bacterium]
MPGRNLTRDEARARADLLDVESYDVSLDLTDGAGNPGEKTFRSRTTVRFRSRRPGEPTWINLIAEQVDEVVLNGERLADFEYSQDGLKLPPLAAENELTVDAHCAYTNTGEGLHRFVDPVDGEVYLYSQFETADAQRMYACFDQPDLKAAFTFHVTAPAHWQVVSSGAAERTEDGAGGATLTHFRTTPRMSTYVTALVAGPYHVARDHHDGIDLGVYCRASLAEHLDADRIFDVTKQGFDYFHRNFGYRYAFGKYDQLFVPEFNAGAMENAGAVTFLEDYVFRSKVTDAAYERRGETILHEMAHMWFGDLVTMRWWDDLWLNESFATYASVECQAGATHWKDAWTTFATLWKSWAYDQDQLPSTHPIAADIVDIEAVEVNFDGITYAKGASVLKQMVHYVGREDFFAGLRAYFQAHEYSNATLGDLLAELERTSGRDMKTWSQQWLETAGVNVLRPEYTVGEDGGFGSFAVLQETPAEHPTQRVHRLAIGLYDLVDGVLRRRDRYEVDIAGPRTEVEALIGVRKPDLILVNDDDLTYCKLRLDPNSMKTAIEHMDVLEGSLPRALVWSAAWDMTRDGELPARDFVALVMRGITSEALISTAQTLQSFVASALTSYAHPDWERHGRYEWAAFSHDQMLAAEPGSDSQLAWARSLARNARSGEHLAVLRGLLDGSVVVDGLTVDTDLRWSLLASLVALGAAGDAEIDAELARDNTAAGQRHAETARALRPTAEAKAEAWQRATGDDSLPNQVSLAVMRGFMHPEHRELTAPYAERYFDAVADVWARRTSEVAQNMVSLLYPSLEISQETLDRTDAWLAGDDIPAPLRRLVLENRDGVRRALAARERDGQA